jgi:membrane protein required for colicin V production
MNWLDIIIIILLVVPILIGLKMGIIKMVLSLVGLIIGVVLASHFYKPLASILGFISNENVANIIAFILILVIVMVIAAIAVRLLKAIASVTMLSWVDHLGGAVFGLLIGAIFCGALLATWVKFLGTDLVIQSFLAGVLLDKFPLVLGLLPSEFDAIRDFFD